MERFFNLVDLADPTKFHDPIKICGQDTILLKTHLNKMLSIRLVEQHLAAMRRDNMIRGPVHLGAGQEAVAVGVSACLRNTDRIFGAHRSHSHVLALGGSIRGLFAEILGKNTGLSRGMGGSMHLWDQLHGFYGSVPIVAGTVPLAVGAGLAAKMQETQDVAVSYFGDGAMEEGVVHESLNLARMLDVPVLFVVENNFFSSHMHISLRQPYNSIARFAHVNGIPFEVVDGNDVVAVSKGAEKLILKARTGCGPGFLEAVTYRWYGHVDWREDIDVGVNRSQEELMNWRKCDPIRRLSEALLESGLMTKQHIAELELVLNEEIGTAWNQALNAPYPDENALLDRVYAK